MKNRLRLHRSLRRAATAVAILLSIFSCSAHPDLIAQIESITEQMKSHGESAALLRERAELFRRHAQFDEALADLTVAARLQTNSPSLSLERAHVLCDANRPLEALDLLEKIPNADHDNAEALLIHARCRAKIGQTEAAISDYTTAIALCGNATPDLYLERAQLQARLGKLDDAVHGLDEALAKSSFASPLLMTAIEYDRRRGAFDSALSRVDTLINSYPVKEPWLTLRAEILEQAGRSQEARETFQLVLAGIGKYPPVRRDLDLTKQLEQHARTGLARVSVSNDSTSQTAQLQKQ